MSILALTSDTLIGTAAAGNLEYNGQFFGTDSNASRAQMQRIVQGTAVASTSGTSINFNSIPAWVKRVTILLRAVISSGGSNFQIQIGAGSVTTSGYVGNVVQTGAGTATVSFTSGLGVTATTASTLATTGMIVFTSFGSNTWSGVAVTTRSDGHAQTGGTTVALSGSLDRVRLTTVNGTDTFTAGSVNILYEG